MHANGEMTSESYRRQSRIINERMEAIEARINALHGRTALAEFGGQVQPTWADMPADDKRSIIRSLMECIEVGPVVKFGSNKFDPDRLNFVWRKPIDIENVHIAFTSLRARVKEGMQRNLRDPDYVSHLEDSWGDFWLEDQPPSPYDGIDPETDLGLIIKDA